MKVKKPLYTFTESIEYREDQFPKQAEENNITAIDLMHMMNHSQAEKAKRLLKIHVVPHARDLSLFCHFGNFDLLRFFRYNGHEFETDINDLYCLEMAGIKVSELLRSLGIDPIDRKAQPKSNKDHYAWIDKQKEQITEAQKKLGSLIENYAEFYIEDIKDKANEDAMAQLEAQYQQSIDEYERQIKERDKTISFLSRKLMEADARMPAAIKYPIEDAPARMVTDDTKIGER